MPLPSLLTAGLAGAASLFLLGAGATISLGATRVVNGAHGAFAVVGLAVCHWASASLGLAASMALAAVVVAALGAATEIIVLRRLQDVSPLAQIVATTGLALILVEIADSFPVAALPDVGMPILVGIAAAVAVSLVLARKSIAPSGQDDHARRTSLAALGAALAGLAGATLPAAASSQPGLDTRLLLDAFAVVLAGGVGSLAGALIAAVLLGAVQAAAPALPWAAPWLPFATVVAIVLVRPAGLLGRAEPGGRRWPRIHRTPLSARVLGAGLLIGAGALCLVRPEALGIVAPIAVAILAAASLHFVAGPGGMPSFGPAACFGLGALAASLIDPVVGGAAALGAAPVLGAGAGLLLALVLVRMPPASVAMLSLWLALLVWRFAAPVGGVSLALRLEWSRLLVVLGGLGGAFLLRRVAAAPLGVAVRAARDDKARAASIGLPVLALRLAAPSIAGAASGWAGGLSLLVGGEAVGHPIAAAAAAVLGGLQTVSGPIVGGLLVSGVGDLARAWWPASGAGGSTLLGIALLGAVILLPDGIGPWCFRRWRRPA